jgi:hypothetical protein
MFPTKKQTSVFTHESNGMVCRESKGSRGLEVNAGSGPVNWNTERRNKFVVMGPQNRGTTYQTVRVNILKQYIRVFQKCMATSGDEPPIYRDQIDVPVPTSVGVGVPA